MICKDSNGRTVNTDKVWAVYRWSPVYENCSVLGRYETEQQAHDAARDFGNCHIGKIHYNLVVDRPFGPPNRQRSAKDLFIELADWVAEFWLTVVFVILCGLGIVQIINWIL